MFGRSSLPARCTPRPAAHAPAGPPGRCARSTAGSRGCTTSTPSPANGSSAAPAAQGRPPRQGRGDLQVARPSLTHPTFGSLIGRSRWSVSQSPCSRERLLPQLHRQRPRPIRPPVVQQRRHPVTRAGEALRHSGVLARVLVERALLGQRVNQCADHGDEREGHHRPGVAVGRDHSPRAGAPVAAATRTRRKKSPPPSAPSSDGRSSGRGPAPRAAGLNPACTIAMPLNARRQRQHHDSRPAAGAGAAGPVGGAAWGCSTQCAHHRSGSPTAGRRGSRRRHRPVASHAARSRWSRG